MYEHARALIPSWVHSLRLGPVFPLSRFFSANQRFVEQGQILFGNRVNFALENPINLWKYDIFVYLNTGLVRNLGHLIVFLEFWAHLFQENLGTR